MFDWKASRKVAVFPDMKLSKMIYKNVLNKREKG